jgi:hypothetical protein
MAVTARWRRQLGCNGVYMWRLGVPDEHLQRHQLLVDVVFNTTAIPTNTPTPTATAT